MIRVVNSVFRPCNYRSIRIFVRNYEINLSNQAVFLTKTKTKFREILFAEVSYLSEFLLWSYIAQNNTKHGGFCLGNFTNAPMKLAPTRVQSVICCKDLFVNYSVFYCNGISATLSCLRRWLHSIWNLEVDFKILAT